MLKRELVGVQYLRGLAALLVVAEHANTVVALPKYFGRAAIPLEFYGGPAGVDLFFVISGFIIGYISLDASSLKPRLDVSDFLWRRFARIVPFLWICVLAYATLRFLGRDGAFEFGPYLRAFTLYPVGTINPTQAWTLRHEFLFYLVFATVFLLPRFRLLPLSLWLLSPLCYFALDPSGLSEFPNFLFNRLNLLFGLGFVVSVLFLKRPHWFAATVSNGMLACSMLCLLYLVPFMLTSYSHLSTIDVLIAGAGACFILYVALRVEAPARLGLLDRLGHAIGDASYAIYLAHGILISGLLGVWARYLPNTNVAVVWLVAVIGALLFGYIVHRYVEAPIVRLFQKRQPIGRSAPVAMPIKSTPTSTV